MAFLLVSVSDLEGNAYHRNRVDCSLFALRAESSLIEIFRERCFTARTMMVNGFICWTFLRSISCNHCRDFKLLEGGGLLSGVVGSQREADLGTSFDLYTLALSWISKGSCGP